MDLTHIPNISHMDEIEVKILNIDKEQIICKLVSLGANKIFDCTIEDFFFDFEDGSLTKRGDLLRLRMEGGRVALTFKRFTEKKDVKRMEEYEVALADLLTMRKILENLGMSVFNRMTKHRTSYELEGTHFEFDKYEGDHSYIPEFLEIESKDSQTIYEYARLLNLKLDDIKPWSVKDIADYYSWRKLCQ